MPAVRDTLCTADTEAPFGEIKPVTDGPPQAVVRDPADLGHVHASGQHEVLDQAADRVVGQRGDDGRAQAEAPAQAAGHVVLAAALPDPELSGGLDPHVARVEAKHHFTQRYVIEGALLAGAQLQDGHDFSC